VNYWYIFHLLHASTVLVFALRHLFYLSIYLPMGLQPFVGPWLLLSFLIFYTVGRTPWTGISPSRGHYLHTQDSTNTEKTHIDIHASYGILTHDPSVWAGEDSSCLRPYGRCDWPIIYSPLQYFLKCKICHFTSNNFYPLSSLSLSKCCPQCPVLLCPQYINVVFPVGSLTVTQRHSLHLIPFLPDP
jgi:hypothetical protein